MRYIKYANEKRQSSTTILENEILPKRHGKNEKMKKFEETTKKSYGKKSIAIRFIEITEKNRIDLRKDTFSEIKKKVREHK